MRIARYPFLPTACLLFFTAHLALPAVTLPALFSDHMVLQRGMPVHVWGTAEPGENVTAAFRDETRHATADNLGLWNVYFSPGAAGGPFVLTVGSSNQIHLNDVLVGDVWVGSGQSNMEMVMKGVDHASEEIAGATNPNIRLFHVPRKVSEYPLTGMEARPWMLCQPETVANFSAVAYFFGRHIQQQEHVPIGLIESSWGGTPAEAWTSLPSLASDASLMPVFGAWARMMQSQQRWLLQRERDWQTATAKAAAEGKPAPPRPWSPNESNSWQPAGLFNGMIAPLTPFPIRGVIWYQGETNASSDRAPLYARLFQALIRDWRHAWGQSEMPFLFVQLASFKTGPNNDWPMLRDAQTQALSLTNTGMAVTIDVGNPTNIHPTDKQDVGLRLALAAEAVTYGRKLEYSGPMYRLAMRENGALRVWFDHAGNMTAKGGSLEGFEIAGADRKFVPATARVEKDSIVVSNPTIAAPVHVRYAWADDPHANLVNGAGLPASPFQTGPIGGE